MTFCPGSFSQVTPAPSSLSHRQCHSLTPSPCPAHTPEFQTPSSTIPGRFPSGPPQTRPPHPSQPAAHTPPPSLADVCQPSRAPLPPPRSCLPALWEGRGQQLSRPWGFLEWDVGRPAPQGLTPSPRVRIPLGCNKPSRCPSPSPGCNPHRPAAPQDLAPLPAAPTWLRMVPHGSARPAHRVPLAPPAPSRPAAPRLCPGCSSGAWLP